MYTSPWGQSTLNATGGSKRRPLERHMLRREMGSSLGKRDQAKLTQLQSQIEEGGTVHGCGTRQKENRKVEQGNIDH